MRPGIVRGCDRARGRHSALGHVDHVGIDDRSPPAPQPSSHEGRAHSRWNRWSVRMMDVYAGYTAPQRNCARVSNTKSQNAMRSRNDLVYGCGSTAVPGIKYGMSDRRGSLYEFVRWPTSDRPGGLARGIVIRAVCFSLVTRGSTRTRGLSPLLMRGCMYVRLNRGWCVTRNTQTTTPPGQSCCTLP